jgi:RimJ/RimL family protein N-acetyltransferase
MKFIETERLILRSWVDADLEPYHKINSDEKVIEFLREPMSPMSLEDCKNFIAMANNNIEKLGFGLWAATLKDSEELIGFIGLHPPDFTAHFTPCVEIGWRLGSQYWGKGLATEGARAVLKFAFEKTDLKEIVSFTVPKNLRSIAVMEKIGLQRDLNGDFNHPKLPTDHRLARHILYRIKNPNINT